MILLSIWALGLLSLGAVVALMYFLKRQARIVLVSTLMFWRGAEENPKSALRLSLRELLGLLLQLLALGFLVIGLARPLLLTPAEGVKTLALVLDGSASMRWAPPDGPRRYQMAVEEALKVLQANPAAEVTLISAQAHSMVLSPPTHDHAQIENLLRSFEPTYQGDPRLSDLISLLQSQSPQGFDRVVYFTDHPPAVDPGALGWEVRLVGSGAGGENLALTRFAVRSQPGGQSYDIFLEAWNSSDRPQKIPLKITADGKTIQEGMIELPPQRAVAYTFNYDGPPALRFVAQLDVSGIRDDWVEDNVRYASLPRPRPWKVLWIGEKNFYLERFLRGLVSLSWQRDWDESILTKEFDLILLSQVEPPTSMAGSFLLVQSALPPWVRLKDAISAEGLTVEATADHPLLAGLEPSDWRLLRLRQARVDPQGQMLLTSGGIPLLYLYETTGLRLAYLGVDLDASNLGLSLDFPILMYRLLCWLAPRAEEDTNLKIGDELPSNIGGPVRLVDPEGHTCEVNSSANCGLVKSPGFYELIADEVVRIYAANVLPEESLLSSLPIEATGANLPSSSSPDRKPSELYRAWPIWPYLLAAGALMLLLELLYFDRSLIPRRLKR